MNKQQVLDFTSAFPPAQKLTEFLIEIDYRENFNKALDFIVTVAAFIAAVATVISQKWQENNMTERLQLAAIEIKNAVKYIFGWAKNTLVPGVVNFISWINNYAIPFAVDMYNDIRSVYNVIRVTF